MFIDFSPDLTTYINDRSNVNWSDLMEDYDPGCITREEIAGNSIKRGVCDGLPSTSSFVFESGNGGQQDEIHGDVLPGLTDRDTGATTGTIKPARCKVRGVRFDVCAMCGHEHCCVSILWTGREYDSTGKHNWVSEFRSNEEDRQEEGAFLQQMCPFSDLRSAFDGGTASENLRSSRQKYSGYSRWLRTRGS